jgi:hypothetical protein
VHVVFQLWQRRFSLAKQKPHRRFWRWGLINFLNESEPDRRAAQQQRVVKQQVQIQIAVHMEKLVF